MALYIDYMKALRDCDYLKKISDDLETDITDTVMEWAICEIERLRAELNATSREAEDLRAFCKGMSMNIALMLKPSQSKPPPNNQTP